MAVLRHLQPHELVFPFTPAEYRNKWWLAVEALKLTNIGPPHWLRHSGPAADIATSRRDLEQVRRRGRWAAMSSVQRYTKEFRLSRPLTDTPTEVTNVGRRFYAAPRDVWAKAMRESPTTSSRLGRTIRQALRARTDSLAAGAPVFFKSSACMTSLQRRDLSNRRRTVIPAGSLEHPDHVATGGPSVALSLSS